MRKPQWQLLRDMLYNAPGHALTLREIEIEGYIRNVPDAAMQARKHGVNITTEYLHANPKIASYVLHDKKLEKAQKKLDKGMREIFDTPEIREASDPTLIKVEPTNRAYR